MKLRWCTSFVFAVSLFLLLLLLQVKAQTPPITPDKIASLSDLRETNLGLSGGDCFKPEAMTLDQISGRLYLLCVSSVYRAETDILLVLNSRTGERIASIHLDETQSPKYIYEWSPSFLILDSSTQHLYLHSQAWLGVLVLDTTTLTKIRWLPLPGSTIVAAGQERLYVEENDGLTAYHPDDLTKVALIPEVQFLAYAPASHHLYVAAAAGVGQMALQILRDDDLALEATLRLPLPVWKIEASSFNHQTNRLYLLVQTKETQEGWDQLQPKLLAVDTQTLAITTQTLNFTPGLGYPYFSLQVDETNGNLYAIVSTEWLVVNGQTLVILARHQRTDQCHNSYDSAMIVIDSLGQLLMTSSDDTLLHRYDSLTGRSNRPLPLGRSLVAAIIHPQDGRMFFVDTLGTLNVLDGASLQPLKQRFNLIEEVCANYYSQRIYSNHIYLALDVEHEHLFVGNGRTMQTLVLDLDTLNTLDQLSPAGPMTLDTVGSRLFLADCPAGKEHAFIHTFDTTTLAKVQPTEKPINEIGKCPGTLISDLNLDMPSKRLFFHFLSFGVSGSEPTAWQSYIIYDLNAMTYLGNLPSDWAESVAFSLDGQRTYLTSSTHDSSSANPTLHQLLIFDQTRQLLKQINGLSGSLAMDDRYIYLLQDQYLLALDAKALETPNQPYLIAVLPLEQAYYGLSLTQGQLYLWNEQHAATISTTDLLAY